MSHRPAFHHSSSSPLPHGNTKRPSIYSSPSTSSSSTLQDVTPSDATCHELPEKDEDEADRTSELEKDRKPKKQVAFCAVSLEIGPIKGYKPNASQLRHTDTSVFHSPPPPRLRDATIQTSKLAAKHLAIALDRGIAQHAQKVLKEKNKNDVGSAQVKTTQKSTPVDAKHSPHVRFSPTTTTITVPPPIVPRQSPPSEPAAAKDLPKSTTEIVFRSDVPPDPSACADINNILRTVLNNPGFDFASYAQGREYIARRVYLASATCSSSATSGPDASPASLPPVDSQTECTLFLEKSLSAIFTPPRLRRLNPQPFIHPDLFIVRCGPDRTSGSSMFAQKEISPHQLIISERPSAIFPLVVALDGPQKEAYFKAFQCLSSDLRNAVCQLDGGGSSSDQGPTGEDRDRNDYQDIFIRNSLRIDLPVPASSQLHPELSAHRGLFLQASRIKHSCRPNAVWSWDIQSFSILIRAVRPIAADEEITLAFVPPEQPYDVRKNALWLTKGLQCLCQSCGGRKGGLEGGGNETSHCKTIQEGDSAREYLVQFRNLPLGSLSFAACDNRSNDQPPRLDCPSDDSIISFEQWLKDRSIPEDLVVTAHKEALLVIQSEGLHILDTQQHKARPTCQLDLSLSDSSEPLCALSSPLSPSSQKKACSQVLPCEQRDVGYHIDALVLCYSALGDTTNFLKCLTKAIKDRDERGAWMLESKLRLRRAVVSTKGPEKDDIRKREREEMNALAFRMRLVFSKWAANPATFPLWARRKAGGLASPAAAGADGFELCDSLEDYALGCLAMEVLHA